MTEENGCFNAPQEEEGGSVAVKEHCGKKRIVGYEKERRELKELGSMLKNIGQYRALGVRIPRGIVLYGEPGVGKTVMARSIAPSGVTTVELRAGEICSERAAECISKGVEFAIEHAPSVLILDELDKIAGASQYFFMQQNDEVNKILLQELDKLQESSAVLVVATCNDTDCLGEALLRPGRFDRQLHIMMPDEKTRKKIFRHYFSRIAVPKDIDFDYIAKITYGKSPADIECLTNEAAINAIRCDKPAITLEDLRYAMNKLALGSEPDANYYSHDDAYKAAVHETGHALVAMITLPDCIHGASIIRQGACGGNIEFVNTDKAFHSIESRKLEISVALAGRVAERVILEETFMGSESDLDRASRIARMLITTCGACDYKFVLSSSYGLGERTISDRTKYEIECKLGEMLAEADEIAEKIIRGNIELFMEIVRRLLKNQFLSREDLFEAERRLQGERSAAANAVLSELL